MHLKMRLQNACENEIVNCTCKWYWKLSVRRRLQHARENEIAKCTWTWDWKLHVTMNLKIEREHEIETCTCKWDCKMHVKLSVKSACENEIENWAWQWDCKMHVTMRLQNAHENEIGTWKWNSIASWFKTPCRALSGSFRSQTKLGLTRPLDLKRGSTLASNSYSNSMLLFFHFVGTFLGHVCPTIWNLAFLK